MSHSQLPTCATSCASSRRSFTFSSSSVRAVTVRSRLFVQPPQVALHLRDASTPPPPPTTSSSSSCRRTPAGSAAVVQRRLAERAQAAQCAVHGHHGDQRRAQRRQPGAETERRPQQHRNDDEGKSGRPGGHGLKTAKAARPSANSSTTISASRLPTSASGGRRSHSTMIGATTIAPTVSPSHQVSQTGAGLRRGCPVRRSSPSARRSTPQSPMRRRQ